jgi:hypothetical protein
VITRPAPSGSSATSSRACGHPSTGYFLAQTDDELLRTVKFLHDRAMTSLSQAAAMQRVSLPDLAGQLRIAQ